MQFLPSRYKNKLPQIGLAILLGFVLLVETVASLFYAAQRIQRSAAVTPLYAFTVSTILTLWVHHDACSRTMSLGIDQAMYIFLAWPITFPLYVLRSRGFRSGSLLLLTFLGICILAFVAAVEIYMAVSIGMIIFSALQS